MTQAATPPSPNLRLRVLMLANGGANQTTGRLFTTLAESLSTRHQTRLQLRQFPRGVFRKVLVLMKSGLTNCRLVARSDILIVHSSLSLSIAEIFFARLINRRILAFIWDFYPDSSRIHGNIRNPILLWLYQKSEKLAYGLCEQTFVPSEDYARYPALAGVRNIEIVPLWPCDPLLAPIGRRLEKGAFSVVFAGQINALRGLPRSIERLARSRSAEVRIDVYSVSPPSLEFSRLTERCPNLTLVHHGFVPPAELPERLRQSLFGLVSLDASFALPAFPSKILTYLAAGIPVIYDGPPMPALERTLRNTRVGITLADLVAMDDAALASFFDEFPAARDAYIASIDASLDRIELSLLPPGAADEPG